MTKKLNDSNAVPGSENDCSAIAAECAPQWSSTPPSEPGWYWVCPANGSGAHLVNVRHWLGRRLHAWHSVPGCNEPVALDDVAEWDGWLWWPIAIQPPEAP